MDFYNLDTIDFNTPYTVRRNFLYRKVTTVKYTIKKYLIIHDKALFIGLFSFYKYMFSEVHEKFKVSQSAFQNIMKRNNIQKM